MGCAQRTASRVRELGTKATALVREPGQRSEPARVRSHHAPDRRFVGYRPSRAVGAWHPERRGDRMEHGGSCGAEECADGGRSSPVTVVGLLAVLSLGALAGSFEFDGGSLDDRISAAVLVHRAPWLTTWFRALTHLGSLHTAVPVALAAAVLLLWRRDNASAVTVVFATRHVGLRRAGRQARGRGCPLRKPRLRDGRGLDGPGPTGCGRCRRPRSR